MFTLLETNDFKGLTEMFHRNGLEISPGEAPPKGLIKCWETVESKDGNRVGGVVLEKRDGEFVIGDIAIEKSFRRHNLGTLMIEKVIEEVKSLGGKRIMLVAKAPEFFKTIGFISIDRQSALLYKNYHQTEKYIEETKMIWHDIDKHFGVMSRLAKNGEYDELNHYLEHYEHDMKKTKSTYLCENKLVNAILTDKFSEAQSKGIQTSFTGNLPEKLNIQGNVICSLLVNMLDNAIEACGKVPYGKEKKLELTLGMKNESEDEIT